MGLQDVRKAVADTIKIGKPQFNVYRTVPARPTYPGVLVVPSDDTTAVRETMCDFVWYIDIYVTFAYTEMETAQDQLDDELSPDNPDSIVTVLNNNSTLGGVVSDATVTAIKAYGPAEAGEAGGAPFIGAQIRLEVRE